MYIGHTYSCTPSFSGLSYSEFIISQSPAFRVKWRGIPFYIGPHSTLLEWNFQNIPAACPIVKKHGITTAERLGEAIGKCLDLIVVQPHMEGYIRVSLQITEIFQRFTDLVSRTVL
ncbi:hypothetical protein [Paenibacillus sp.]|uniref:Y-family DNA polymerase n=1 Tax=Paenibacillus sp. TaxID=58172 RepID=UPI003463DF1E